MANDQSLSNSNHSPVKSEAEVLVMSYNMHGYNQEVTTLKLLIESKHSEVIMLQEHWGPLLTYINLARILAVIRRLVDLLWTVLFPQGLL